MIIAPQIMTNEKDQKKAAQKCFDSVGLDPDMYRIGHTKARIFFDLYFLCYFCSPKVYCFFLSQFVHVSPLYICQTILRQPRSLNYFNSQTSELYSVLFL